MGRPPRQIIGNIKGESIGRRKRDRTGASNSVTFFGSILDELAPTDSRSSTARPGKKQKPTLRSGIPIIKAGSATVRKINSEEKKSAKEDLKRLSAAGRNRLNEYGAGNDGDIEGFGGWTSAPMDEAFNIDHSDLDEGEEKRNIGITNIDVIDGLDGPEVVIRQHRQRSRRARLIARQKAFDDQVEDLANAYLKHKHHLRTSHTLDKPCDVDIPPPNHDASDGTYYTISDACGFIWRRENWPIRLLQGNKWMGENLIASGLLSNVPHHPFFAVSLRALEMYRNLRLAKPNFGIQAFVKSMCMNQGRTCTNSLIDKFSDTFDVYLSILRTVDQRVQKALARDTSHWRVQHFCPACTHRIPGEDSLKHSVHLSLDGGMSNKRFKDAGGASGDLKSFDSSYILSRETVDEWKNAIKRRVVLKKKKGKRKGRADDDASNDSADDEADKIDVARELGEHEDELSNDEDEYIVKNLDGDPTDGMDFPSLGAYDIVCTERFKAAAADEKKSMHTCFDESGLMVAICRHGVVIAICDMVKSGELAKYPLALLHHIEQHVPGEKMVGYDIWCAFKQTIKKANLQFTGEGNTCGMHGWSHNRRCQTANHPLYSDGAGLTDFEQCERWFSQSNLVAVLSRHATRFHRHQWIDLFCRQSDRERIEALGRYIYYNYKQALDILQEQGPTLHEICRLRGYKASDFHDWLKEEQAYLETLRKEPEDDNLRCLYVEAIEEYWEATKQANESEARKTTNRVSPQDHNTRVDSTKRKSQKTVKTIWADHEAILERCTDLETRLGIHRWTENSPEYHAAREYANNRKYRLLLDKVEGLVVQRLMEMQKCNVRGTNYKTRTAIFKSLKARSPAIKRAVTAYNTLARKLGRETLDFKETMQYSFLTEFDMLRIGREDILKKPWAHPHFRAVRDVYFKIGGARAEIQRLHLEINHIYAWMDQEQQAYEAAIAANQPELASELRGAYDEQQRVQRTIRYWLAKCQRLDGYRGKYYDEKKTVTSRSPDDELAGDELPADHEVEVTVDNTEELLERLERLG